MCSFFASRTIWRLQLKPIKQFHDCTESRYVQVSLLRNEGRVRLAKSQHTLGCTTHAALTNAGS